MQTQRTSRREHLQAVAAIGWIALCIAFLPIMKWTPLGAPVRAWWTGGNEPAQNAPVEYSEPPCDPWQDAPYYGGC
jgi:hypothetical protein